MPRAIFALPRVFAPADSRLTAHGARASPPVRWGDRGRSRTRKPARQHRYAKHADPEQMALIGESQKVREATATVRWPGLPASLAAGGGYIRGRHPRASGGPIRPLGGSAGQETRNEADFCCKPWNQPFMGIATRRPPVATNIHDCRYRFSVRARLRFVRGRRRVAALAAAGGGPER